MRLIDADAIPWTDLNDTPNSKIKVLVTFAEKVNRMPSIEERKKGQWHKCDNDLIAWYKCSVCGCEPLRSKWNGEYVYSDFCPTCGADMRGEEDETSVRLDIPAEAKQEGNGGHGV